MIENRKKGSKTEKKKKKKKTGRVKGGCKASLTFVTGTRLGTVPNGLEVHLKSFGIKNKAV